MPSIYALASYRFDLFALVVFAISAFLLATGVSVLRANPKDPERRAYAALSTILFLVLLFIALPLASVDRDVAAFWDRIGWAAVCLVPPAVLWFESLHLGKDAWRRALPALWTLSALLALTIPTGLFVDASRIVAYPWGSSEQLSWFGYFFVIEFYAVFLFCLYGHWKSASNPGLSDRRRMLLKTTFWALAVGALGSSDFLAYVGVPWPPFSFVFLTGWVAFMGYAIVRHKAFAITTEIAAPAIVESMPGALFVVNVDGEIVITNPQAAKLTRTSPDEMRGARIDAFLPSAEAILEKARNDGAIGALASEDEAVLRASDGTETPIALSALTVRDGLGNAEGVTFIAVSIEKIKDQLDTIAAQKVAMEESVTEMKRIQKMLVGRELKMVELKDEVDRLRAELERSKGK